MNNRTKLRSALILPLLILLMAAASGCRSQKEVTAPVTSTAGFDGIAEAQRAYDAVRVPFTLNLRSPKQVSIGGVATMTRDSLVILSLRMLGMELGALQASADSLLVVEKMGRQYLSMPIAKVLGGFDVTMANIQDILTGRMFLLGADSLTPAMRGDFRFKDDRGGITIVTPHRQPSGATYRFTLADGSALDMLSVTADGHKQVNLKYGAPASTPAGIFASDVSLRTELGKNLLDFTIKWDWAKARFDTDVDVKPVKIGRDYKPLSIDKLLKAAADKK